MLALKGKGNWLILLILVINLIFWITSKQYFQDSFSSPFKYLAKIASLTGTLMMSITLLLSTKTSFLEYLFGGLDKVYKSHHTYGRWAFTLLVLHPIFLSFVRLPNVLGVFEYFIPSFEDNYYIGHGLGLITLLLFFVLIYLTISKTINYELWLKTHSMFGLVYLLGIVHILLVSADIYKYQLFGIWYYFWLLVGVVSYLWIAVFYNFFGKKYKYKITNKEVIGNVTEFTFTPLKNAIKHKPGQFLYTRFLSDGLKDEVHPYSIASYSEDGNIKMGIKALGDHTKLVQDCGVGLEVEFTGPFGGLSEKVMLNNDKKVVLIGGGIGITPMISIWEYILKHKHKQAQLIYVASFKEEASFDDDFIKLNSNYGLGNNDYWLYLDGKKDFFNVEKLKNKIITLENTVFLLCGPKAMTNSIIKVLKEEGVSNANIVLEDFDFGIGKNNWFVHIKELFV